MRHKPPRRHILVASLAALTSGAIAACGRDRLRPTPADRQQQPGIAGGTLGLGIVGLAVRDLPRSLAFYRRLGLPIPADIDTSEGAFRLALTNGQVFFWETVSYIQGFDPTYRQGTGDRKVILEFGFAEPGDVNTMYDTLIAAGAQGRFPPTAWNDGKIRYAIVIDPDDNQISLRWPLVS